jgi:hypothetical protein
MNPLEPIQATSWGAETAKAPSASQSQRCQSRTPTPAASATATKAIEPPSLAVPTKIGAARAPSIPMLPTSIEDQRTATMTPTSPINAAASRPRTGEIKSYVCVATTVVA